MPTTDTTNNVTNSSATSNALASNKRQKNAELDKDAFMKLFLEQLKAQDPTAPMETEKILEQTAMMTQLEQQEEMKKTLAGMTETMNKMTETSTKLAGLQESMASVLKNLGTSLDNTTNVTTFLAQLAGYNSVGMIGKIAETNVTGLNIKNNDAVKFDLYFDEPIDASRGTPTLRFYDEKQNLIREESLAAHHGKQGYISFQWDTKKGDGAFVSPGAYHVVAEYNHDSATNKYKETRIGRGEVQSIIYENNIPHVKLGNTLVVPIGNVTQFNAKG